ncbi:hypothetical protein C8F04DRAFT_1209152 [Mycena alexandri]|uniref:Uncharacterized protein n=1 Tax=Mycena alexandri TaxID=1745969 RepID=A0AAD6T562_9AGAR|nr:hypothetical protein C8F04DRAFT_1209152 [Mycena alexandri]
MPKLHLKRTPQEEADHRAHKKRKRDSQRVRKSPDASGNHNADKPTRKWDSSDSDGDDQMYGPQPPQPEAGPSSKPLYPESSYKPDYDAIRAELEEARFREKMAGAFDDDDRLDSLEARMNDYAHVPDRWRTGRAQADYEDAAADDLFKLDPRHMDEEEYAEWIRAGMYRKTHAQEYAEEQQKKAARDARRAEEKAAKAETARLAKLAEEDRKRKKLEKEIRRSDYAREEYHVRWKNLLAAPSDGESVQASLAFSDIPWPIVSAHRQKPDKKGSSKPGPPPIVSLDELTHEAITSFLVPSPLPIKGEKEKKLRKEKLRETFLRFHPDKFEGRLMNRVRESDRERVREAVGIVVRALNALMVEA